jgi:hypothetical protein
VEVTELRVHSGHGRSPDSTLLASVFWTGTVRSRCCRRPTTKNAFYLPPPFPLVVLLCWTGRPLSRTYAWSPTFFFLWQRGGARSAQKRSAHHHRRRGGVRSSSSTVSACCFAVLDGPASVPYVRVVTHLLLPLAARRRQERSETVGSSSSAPRPRSFFQIQCTHC